MHKKTITLTETERRILEYLKSKSRMIAPVSLREIANDVGVSSTSVVVYYLNRLEDADKITRPARTARGIEVIDG